MKLSSSNILFVSIFFWTSQYQQSLILQSIFSGFEANQLFNESIQLAIDRSHQSLISLQHNNDPHHKKEVLALCTLDNTTTFRFNHFPHAAQTLYPCWSWFERTRKQFKTYAIEAHCGFYVKDPKHIKIIHGEWVDQLIMHMGCSIIYAGDPNVTERRSNTLQTGNITMFYTPPYRSQRWFERIEHARSLRSKVLQSINCFDEDCAHRNLRIAIINRKSSRRFLNIDEISEAIRRTYPSARVEVAKMEDMNPIDQFVFWSQHDIVVIGHGAALTNLIFMPPRRTSVVIEVFPEHYYLRSFFLTLRNSAGIRGYGYYNNLSEAEMDADWTNFSQLGSQRVLYRSPDLNPPINEILALVYQAVSESGQNLTQPLNYCPLIGR